MYRLGKNLRVKHACITLHLYLKSHTSYFYIYLYIYLEKGSGDTSNSGVVVPEKESGIELGQKDVVVKGGIHV